MNSSIFVLNPLEIPQVTATYITAVFAIAGAFIPILFMFQVLAEQKKLMLGEKPEYARVLINTSLILIGFFLLYKWTFLKIVSACEAIAWSMQNAKDWSDFVAAISANQSASITIVKLNFPTIVAALLTLVIQTIEGVFLTVRYIFLCILYIVGPLAFISALTSKTREFFKGWLTSLVQISFWVIPYKIMQVLLLIVYQQIIQSGGGLTDTIMIGIIITLITVSIPSLTAALLSQGNLGTMATMVMAGATAISMRYGGHEAVHRSMQRVDKTAKGLGNMAYKASGMNAVVNRFKKGNADKGAPPGQNKTR